MTYDTYSRRTISLHFPGVDFGTDSDIEKIIQLPTLPERDSSQTQKFNGARVVGVMITNITEDFLGSVSDAGIQVGDGSDPDMYYDSGLVLDEEIDVDEAFFLPDDGSAIDIPSGASSVGLITITWVANDHSGTPTGIADVTLIIDLF